MIPWPHNWVIPDLEGPPTPRMQGSELFSEPKDKKLPPMNCYICSHYNEYVGPEHLDEYGRYKCRTCKKRY